jgi:hypothetical protein
LSGFQRRKQPAIGKLKTSARSGTRRISWAAALRADAAIALVPLASKVDHHA